jgi:SAM-dependent methyltransferase
MGDVNQYEWVKEHFSRTSSPVLEVGSKNYGSVSYDYRSLFAGIGEYVGTDLAPGNGVEIVADLTSDFESLPERLRKTKFGTIICMSVMEHVRDVYRFAANLRRLLADDGIAFISVPWVWRFHGYPSDYWRFSPEALKFLFEPLVLDVARSCISFKDPGAVRPLSNDILNVYPDYEADYAPRTRAGRLAERIYTRLAGRLAPPSKRSRGQVLYPTMINAVFQKTRAA